MHRIAVLDDYQSVAADFCDWSRVPGQVEVVEFHEHLGNEDAVAAALQDWALYAIALAFVLLHHALVAAPTGQEETWRWLVLHGGFVLADGTWIYVESNGVDGLQRGGSSGPCLPSEDLCLTSGVDPINDENCGHGPDTIVF